MWGTLYAISPVLGEASLGPCGLHLESTVPAGRLRQEATPSPTQFVLIVDPPLLPVTKSDTGAKLVLTR